MQQEERNMQELLPNGNMRFVKKGTNKKGHQRWKDQLTGIKFTEGIKCTEETKRTTKTANKEFDFKKIQELYDSGMTWKEIANLKLISIKSANKYAKLGVLRARTQKEARRLVADSGKGKNTTAMLIRYRKKAGYITDLTIPIIEIKNWEEIQKDYDNNNLSIREICKKHQVGRLIITEAIQLGLFKKRTQKETTKISAKNRDKKEKRVYQIDWNSIQEDYNSGMERIEIYKKYKIYYDLLHEAINLGFLKVRTRSEATIIFNKKRLRLPFKHSEETKLKMSIYRKKYLDENPDKVPNRLSSKESNPEKIFRMAMIRNRIRGWKKEHPMRRYSYDFAFIDIKLDVEIDGQQHEKEKAKMKDKERDEWTRSQGWDILRFKAKDVKNNLDQCIQILKERIEFLTSNNLSKYA